MTKMTDITGQRFGTLVVLHRDATNGKMGNARWVCQCDCGKVKSFVGVGLRARQTASCGCMRGKRSDGGHWQDKPTAKRWTWYRKNARDRSLEWGLTMEQFKSLTHQPCHYCGDPDSHGVDRMDNDIGYVTDNCCACCRTCNRAKLDLGYNAFMAWVDRLVARRIKEVQNEKVGFERIESGYDFDIQILDAGRVLQVG